MPFTPETARAANKIRAAYASHKFFRALGFPNLRRGKEVRRKCAAHRLAIRTDSAWFCACGLSGRELRTFWMDHAATGIRFRPGARLSVVLLFMPEAESERLPDSYSAVG